MNYALSLGKRHTGLTADNPSVGCVLVKDNHIIGCGTTAIGGRPHAETIALQQAKEHAFGATLYVTLEPCSHFGQTSPCSQSVIKAGIKNVYIGCIDPNPVVSGNGIKDLQQAGINVHVGILESAIHKHHRPFFLSITEKRPFYTLKFAASLDGRITYAPHDIRKQISSDSDIQKSHLLRSRHHAIAVGINTIIDDNPLLNCRLNGHENFNPDVIIFDRKCRLPDDAKIFSVKNRRIIVFHSPEHTPHLVRENIIYAPFSDDIEQINQFLVIHKIHSVLLEGGATLNSFFLNSGFIDNIISFHGDVIIGNKGKEAFHQLANPFFLNSIKDF